MHVPVSLLLCLMLFFPASVVLANEAREPVVTLLATGDLTPGHHFERYLDERKEKDGWSEAQAVAYGFQHIGRETRAADIFLTNLECPLTSRGEKLEKNFAFRASPWLARVLVDGGVDVASLANNHLYDYGSEGLFDTLTSLQATGIGHFGAGGNLAAAREPAIVERNGLKVAFLGYFFLGDRNIEPPAIYATDTKPGVAGCFKGDECIGQMVEEDIKNALEKADIVVPYFHWGREAQDEVMPYQRTLAHRAVDAGAQLVLGAHPHVIHGIEEYKGVPIAYSLGNFIFGGNWNPRVKTSIAVRVTLTKQGVRDFEVWPMQYTVPPDGLFQPRWLELDEATAVVEKMRTMSAVFEKTLPFLTLPTVDMPAVEPGSPAP